MKVFKCENCGNIVELVKESGVPVMCCGQKMTELFPGTSDGAFEKHIPVVEVEGKNVKVMVGEVAHPMVEAHYIEWIVIETTKGIQKKNLKPSEEPKAAFIMTEDEELISAYAYCNLHGFWKSV